MRAIRHVGGPGGDDAVLGDFDDALLVGNFTAGLNDESDGLFGLIPRARRW